jgi:branched-subunit amino acid aminotransferase/4-amino-4-deoxychorismate lyase
VTGIRRRWSESTGELVAAPVGGRVDVIDSWLVTDGRVIALDDHLGRFTAACSGAYGVPPGRTGAFLRAVLGLLPTEGRWFPRVELTIEDGEPVFHLWVRPAPARGSGLRAWVYHGPDERRQPRIKGPDLDWITRVRGAAQRRGADEAVLVSPDGRLLEGTTTGLLWWWGDTLYVTDERDRNLLPSVTRAVLVRIAAETGTRVARAAPRPADLDGCETWAVNALHGIRSVREWIGSAIVAAPSPRSALWQERLAALGSDAYRESVR